MPAVRLETHIFQSTLPQGERLQFISQVLVIFKFQSTLPQGERLMDATYNATYDVISIHAPARGATYNIFFNVSQERISIHAPARGATHCRINCYNDASYFNPRSRKGSDAFDMPDTDESHNFNPRSRKGSDLSRINGTTCVSIAIHAPARGATTVEQLRSHA